MKYCGKCRQLKEDDTVHSWCRECMKEYHETRKEQTRLYYQEKRRKFPAYGSKNRIRVNGTKVGG